MVGRQRGWDYLARTRGHAEQVPHRKSTPKYARMDGQCQACGEPIAQGVSVIALHARGVWVHLRCEDVEFQLTSLHPTPSKFRVSAAEAGRRARARD